MEDNDIVIPGQRIALESSNTRESPGVYRSLDGTTYASIVCLKSSLGSIQTHYSIGSIVLGVVSRVLLRKGVEIRLVGNINKGLKVEYDSIFGLLRPQDIGCWNIGKHSESTDSGLIGEHLESIGYYWINDCYRPGDIVKCTIISVSPQILVSTNQVDLGCVFTPCTACNGERMAYPISYNTVLCKDCKTPMLRKTSRPCF
ncbi:uncharacterized protein CMU_024130 [Cryptosporidium muris RN66]|uniref:Exosome complex component N-terminal domain-containing protein n=1 Tax=Cryptosporidium muris (strain RN66) TaxID=441375 RepID=B6AC55_CRYMR|nr:uncharacterized protein CMU_024130 [Cryptosporidium muris RN66]EEA05408.1 hypothetical protein, conserved [Cryptosporidium muris RN66]|eukprot:XP_002139757.1 hypothetical protein [Cryptosporidium muris RN66]